MNYEFARVEKAIEKQNRILPYSGVINLRSDNKTVFKKAYGLANKSDRIPNRIDTRFAIASGSKIFTAVAILQLIERGKISLNTRIKDCLAFEFPEFDPDVSIYHLLTHSSGIPDYFDEEASDDYELVWQHRPMYMMRSPKDFLPMFQNEKMKFPPGARFAYSDGGFIILGLIIERYSEMEFKDYIEKHIFKAAGMIDSGYYATDRLPERTAYGYIEDDDGSWRTNFFAVPVIGAPDGGAYTTADDLTRFWRNLLGGKLLSLETVSDMINPHIEAKSEREDLYYGLGIWISKKDERVESYYITGWDPGAAMISEIFPGNDISITLLSNSNKATFPKYNIIRETLGL